MPADSKGRTWWERLKLEAEFAVVFVKVRAALSAGSAEGCADCCARSLSAQLTATDSSDSQRRTLLPSSPWLSDAE